MELQQCARQSKQANTQPNQIDDRVEETKRAPPNLMEEVAHQRRRDQRHAVRQRRVPSLQHHGIAARQLLHHAVVVLALVLVSKTTNQPAARMKVRIILLCNEESDDKARRIKRDAGVEKGQVNRPFERELAEQQVQMLAEPRRGALLRCSPSNPWQRKNERHGATVQTHVRNPILFK